MVTDVGGVKEEATVSVGFTGTNVLEAFRVLLEHGYTSITATDSQLYRSARFRSNRMTFSSSDATAPPPPDGGDEQQRKRPRRDSH